MPTDFSAIWRQPEKLFRALMLACLAGWGIAIIYVASHVGPLYEPPVHTRDLASYLFSALLLFLFFYAQYRVVPRVLKRALDTRLGLWHAGGSAVLLLIGALTALLPQGQTDVPSMLLFWMLLLGEGLFLANVVWSYVKNEPVVPVLPAVGVVRQTPVPVRNDSAKNMGWPKSPVKLFGIGAGFFAAGGVVSLLLNVPAYQIPVPISGQLHFMPFGLMWMAAALPFVIFALLYKFLVDAQRLQFEDSMNRIHFVTTIIAVIDLVRVFMGWQQALVSKMWAMYFGPEFGWLAVLFGLSAVVFAINALRGYNRSSARP